MKKGMIFIADRNQHPLAIHPIIYWADPNGEYFEGLMITSSSGYGNLDLSSCNLFESNHDKFKATYIVHALLLKPVDWLDSVKVWAHLSAEGIVYVSSKIEGMMPITWEEYLATK